MYFIYKNIYIFVYILIDILEIYAKPGHKFEFNEHYQPETCVHLTL